MSTGNPMTTTRSTAVAARAERVLMPNYGRRDLCLVRGKGARVWDADGNEYIDFLAGIAVCCLGHNHPKVTAALQRQAEEILHVSNIFLIEPQVRAAERLVELSDMDRVFFCNSGGEANEGAIKMARRYSYNKYGEGRGDLIALEGSFHGRTMGAITLTGQPKYHEGFGPMLPGVSYAPINDFDALVSKVTEKTCGIFIEPVQGEGGIRPCDRAYLERVRRLCDERDILLIFDEVQCGMGRIGTLFAYQHYDVIPDAITLAKGLGGGMPVGALLARGVAAETLIAGTHATTFGGNFLASAAANAVLETLVNDGVLNRVQTIGAYLRRKADELASRHSLSIKDVRGLGLMLGMEMAFPVADVLKQLRERGLIAASAGPNVLRLVPPYVIEEADIDRFMLELDLILAPIEAAPQNA